MEEMYDLGKKPKCCEELSTPEVESKVYYPTLYLEQSIGADTDIGEEFKAVVKLRKTMARMDKTCEYDIMAIKPLKKEKEEKEEKDFGTALAELAMED
jgi:hypothetical protein